MYDGVGAVPSSQSEAHKLRRQVSTLSQFGKRALKSDDIDGLLQEATRLVSDAIDVELVKVLELTPDGENLLVRAGVNWNPGVVGNVEIPAHEGSPAGYALHTNQPVITEDTEREVRFEIPKLLIEHSVRSTVNVVIRGEDRPFGVLELTRGSFGNSSRTISIFFRTTPIFWRLLSSG